MRLREVERYDVAQDWVRWRLAVTPAMNFCVLYRWRTFRISRLIPNVPKIIVILTDADSNAHTNDCTITLHTKHHFGIHISIYSEIFTITSGICFKVLSLCSIWN